MSALVALWIAMATLVTIASAGMALAHSGAWGWFLAVGVAMYTSVSIHEDHK